MRVFKDVKLVEQLGSGVQRILKEYDRSIFQFSPNFLKVSFPIKNAGKNAGITLIKLNSTQKDIMELVKQNKYITQNEISKILNKNISTIQRNMIKLQEQKIIKRVGSYTKGYWDIIE